MSRNVVIGTLVIEEDREEHIAKHDVTLDEVLEIVSGNYVYIKAKLERWLIIGKTKKERFLSIVVGERNTKNVYGLVTARPSRKEEKSFYNEFTLQGGEKDDKSKKS